MGAWVFGFCDMIPLTQNFDTRATAARAGPKHRLAIIWEGPQLALHSFAFVNRAFCQGLLDRGHDVSIVPERRLQGDDLIPRFLTDRFHYPLERPADAHVRQTWPPDFTPPLKGHWVVVQPWEYGSLPICWAHPIGQAADEVWAYSGYVKGVYVRSGVPAERVHVVPLGVDIKVFHPGQRPLTLKTKKRFKFLFVGGTIFRKGFDGLLAAYLTAFRHSDDVCLIVKDFGVNTFYEGQTGGKRIAQFRAYANAPEIEYLDANLTPEEMAGLYCACDCLAHPYRGEGFGLPIAEAMACNLPVIVTGMGAAMDFCNTTNAFLIPARKDYYSRKHIAHFDTVDLPWIAEPNWKALCQLLRYVHAHPEERRVKGKAGCDHIRAHFRWDQAVAIAEKRLLTVRQMPIRRNA